MAQDKRPRRGPYNKEALRDLRAAYFLKQPRCIMCLAAGITNDGSLTATGAA